MITKKNLFPEENESSYEEFHLDMPEEHDEGLKQRFISYCVDNAIPQEHAQAFMLFLQEEQECVLENAYSCTEKTLKSTWGTRFGQNLQRAKKALIALDRKLGGRLIPFFESGYGNQPLLIEMLAEIGSMTEEDSIGLPASGKYGEKAMSTEDFLTKVVFKNS